MKKNIGKRILSLALALVMVAGMLPHMATEAHAAEPITLEGETFKTSPGEGFAVKAYFFCYGCDEYVYIDSNIENHKFEITSFTYKIANGTAQWNLTANYQGCLGSGTGTNSKTCNYICTEKLYNYYGVAFDSDSNNQEYAGLIAVDIRREKTAHQGDATCKTAANCTLCGTSYTNASNHEKPNEFTYSVNTSDSTNHDVKYACCGATKETVAHTAEPTYTVNVTDHTKHDKTYSCCEGIAETTGHSYTYTANDSVLTETCANNCGHQAIASIVAGEAIYTGSEITNAATISYDSGTWAGDAPVLSFENNVNVGTATAKMTAGDATASTTFKINPANLSNVTVTLDPASGVYDGSYHDRPNYTLTYNDKDLVKGTDYIVDGQWTGDFLNAGDSILTLKGEGNFTGTKTLTYTIHKATLTADLFEMTLPQNPVYDGTTAHSATVTSNAVGLGEITVKYNGSDEAPINAGAYTVTVYVAEGDNYKEATSIELGSFAVAQANGTASVSVADVEYGDAVTPVPVSATNGTDHVTYQYKVKGADDSTYTDEVPTEVGQYTVKATFAATNNYKEATATDDFTITKRQVTATVTAQNKTYDGTTDASVTATVAGVYGDTFEISGLTGAFSDATAGENKTVTVDSSNASVTGTNVGYYEISFPATTTATIGKKSAAEIQWPTAGSLNYGQKLSDSALTGTDANGTFAWKDGNIVPNVVNDGYTVVYTPNDAVNYDYDSVDLEHTVNITVNPVTAVVTAAPTAKDLTYDGTDLTLIAAGSTNDGTLVYSFEKEGTYTETLPQAMDAGTYTVWYKVDADSNHTDTEPASVTVEIKKADASVGETPVAISGLVYNGREQYLITSAVSMDGTVYYSLDGVTYTESLPKGTNAQEYTVYYKVVGDVNHNDMEPKTVTATIAPLNIGTVSIKGGVLGDSFTYNGQEHTPDVQIDVFIPSGEANVPSTEVRLTKDTDYTVTYSNNVNAGEAVVTFTGKGNYTGTITRKFTIDPKELDGSAVSIPDMSLPYTGEAQTVAIVVPEGVTYELVEGTMTATNAGMYGFTIQFTGNHTGMTSQGWQITAVAPNATAPTANILTYNGEDQTLIAAGATNDGTMVYSLEKEGEYKAELPKAKTAGTYHVWYKVIGDGNHTDSAPASVEVKIDKADPGIGAVTANVVENTLNSGAIVLTRENTDIDGNLTVDAEQTLAWGNNTIRYTFTPEDTTNYKAVKGEVTVSVVDTIAPVGTVSIDDNKWNDLWNTITFGLFFKETKTVKVEVATDLSGIAKVEYYDSATALSADAVKAITAWTDMGADYAQNVTAEDAKTFIYYIRIIDKAGNVTYISTADATYDLTKPVISGITNGSIYFTTQKVTVTDTNLESVTLNGETVTGEITLAGNVDKTYTIVATDKAGNETTCTVTMKAIAAISAPIDSIDESNVNSGNTDAIAEVEAAAAALDTTNATDAEKAAIKAITDKCDALQEVIADTAAEYERITDAIAAYDPDEVTSADKAALDKLAEDLEALAESGNLTDSEKTALETPAETLNGMIETVTEVAAEADRIADAVGDYDQETVKSSDKEEIEQLAEDIDALLATDNLTDEERTALEGEKTKCENLLAKIEGTDALVDKLTEDVGSYDEDTVKSTDKAALEQLVEDIEAVIEGNTNITEEEKTELEALVDTVEDLLTKIEEVAQAPVTEDTEKVEDTTSENVTPEDKEDLTNAKADLENALTENAGNYTEDEKKAIQDEIDRIDDALEAIENVEAAEETVSKLPAVDNVEPDDEDAIKAITDAKAEYDALTDHEKSLVGEDTKKKLDDLCAALVAYDIIKGENGKYTQGGSKGLSFTANGAYSKFTGILVDNKVVDSKHYTAESGSTVITLKASYLDTLSTGKHTLTVVYTDGETSCEFNIAAKSATPATGDNFNILLWTSVMIISLAAITVLLIEQKKRRYVK